MKWNVLYTKTAKQDLKDIYKYICFELKAPNTAKNLLEKITNEIDKLDELPLRYRVYMEEPWSEKGVRFFPVDNYLVFYAVDQKEKNVSVLRIMYAGRDITKQFNEKLFV